ncbi:hypothetical protein [Haloparvum sp. PAK95]|uniref:hypothetical protein n=1 Tax=Haloparvum sp. PAK95 TaxID=3418962 RepID=UPI003D2F3B50
MYHLAAKKARRQAGDLLTAARTRQKLHVEEKTPLTDRRVRRCAQIRTRAFLETTKGDTDDFDGTLDDPDDVDNDRDPFRQESMVDFAETTGAAPTRMTGCGTTTVSAISARQSYRTEDIAAYALFNANYPALSVVSDDD